VAVTAADGSPCTTTMSATPPDRMTPRTQVEHLGRSGCRCPQCGCGVQPAPRQQLQLTVQGGPGTTPGKAASVPANRRTPHSLASDTNARTASHWAHRGAGPANRRR
jgi:hypothetical protein